MDMSEAVEIPATLGDITAVWLTKALRSREVLGETAIAAVNIESLGAVDFGAQVVRLHLEYDRQADYLPASLIAKVPHNNPDPFHVELLAKEIRIYQELLDKVNVPTPHCYFGGVDLENGRNILLLEDLSHLRQVGFDSGVTFADAELLLTQFARHQAEWWQSPQLEKYEFLNRIAVPTYDEAALAHEQAIWSQFADTVSQLLPDAYLPTSFLDMGQRYFAQIPETIGKVLEAPFTLVHEDIHPLNLLFAASENDPPSVVLDWPWCAIGPGVRDIGYFLIFSLPVQTRRQGERKLLQTYHTTLVQQGVSNYNFEQCWRDYRLSFFKPFHTLVGVVSAFDLSHPVMAPFIKAAIGRIASFAEDHCVDEFLQPV
jgi:hypothetical protein